MLFLWLCAIGVCADQPPTTVVGSAMIVSRQAFPGGLCLFVPSAENGTAVAVRACPSGTAAVDPGFLWRARRTVDGAWWITSARTREERRIEVQHAGKENHARILIWGPAAPLFDKQQIWSFLPVDDGFRIVGLDSGKCLNVPLGRRPLNEEEVQLYDCEAAPNSTWTVRTASGAGGR
jgi:hypothetical protein